jgi:3'-phosphoadenosine 5'-phosphosulfate sulfotransferase (PAPS reductase)/FAD synthetase
VNEIVVSRFSCGAASAVATSIAIKRYGDRVDIVNAEVAAEHPDNLRFRDDCERWFGLPIIVLRDTEYDAEPLKVWFAKRFIASSKGAPCSKALKGRLLDTYRPYAPMVLGYTSDEADRLDRFIDANADRTVIAPLIEEGITKDDCFHILADAGLKLPVPYLQGFQNSNCLMCPKGGLGYWKHLDRYYPENYEQVAQLQDALGPGSYFLSDRRGGKRVRLSLRMLREIDEPRWRIQDEPRCHVAGCVNCPSRLRNSTKRRQREAFPPRKW